MQEPAFASWQMSSADIRNTFQTEPLRCKRGLMGCVIALLPVVISNGRVILVFGIAARGTATVRHCAA